MKTISIKITFVEPALGASPSNKQLYSDYILSKAPDASTKEDEIKALGADEVTEKGTTVFPGTMDGKPFIYDYQVKGFFKEACKNLRNDKTTESSKIKNFMKRIDGNVFVYAKGVRPNVEDKDFSWKKLVLADQYPIDIFERPLRASTPQGDRVGLARSEMVPAGSNFTCDIVCLTDELEPLVREWLDYGIYKGLLQFRNAGYGRFVWEEIE